MSTDYSKYRTRFFTNQEPVVEDFNFIEESRVDKESKIVSDYYTNGVISGILDEFNVSGSFSITNKKITLSVNKGVGYVNGKRIIVNDTLPWDPTAPNRVIDDELVPQSTGSQNINIDMNFSGNTSVQKIRLFITHLIGIDTSSPSLDVDPTNYKRRYKYMYDGYVVGYAKYDFNATAPIEPNPSQYNPPISYANNNFIERDWLILADVYVENNQLIILHTEKPISLPKAYGLLGEESPKHNQLQHHNGISNLKLEPVKYIKYHLFNVPQEAFAPVSTDYGLTRTVQFKGKLKFVKVYIRNDSGISIQASDIWLKIEYNGQQVYENGADSMTILDGNEKVLQFTVSTEYSSVVIPTLSNISLSIKTTLNNAEIVAAVIFNDQLWCYLGEEVEVLGYKPYQISIVSNVDLQNNVVNDVIKINFPNPTQLINNFIYVNGNRIEKIYYKGTAIWRYGVSGVVDIIPLTYSEIPAQNNNNEYVLYLCLSSIGFLSLTSTILSNSFVLAKLVIRAQNNYETVGGLCIDVKDYRYPTNIELFDRLSCNNHLYIFPNLVNNGENINDINIHLSPFVNQYNQIDKDINLQILKNIDSSRLKLNFNDNTLMDFTTSKLEINIPQLKLNSNNVNILDIINNKLEMSIPQIKLNLDSINIIANKLGVNIDTPSTLVDINGILTVRNDINLQKNAHVSIGSIDNYEFSLKTNNINRITLSKNGNLYINMFPEYSYYDNFVKLFVNGNSYIMNGDFYLEQSFRPQNPFSFPNKIIGVQRYDASSPYTAGEIRFYRINAGDTWTGALGFCVRSNYYNIIEPLRIEHNGVIFVGPYPIKFQSQIGDYATIYSQNYTGSFNRLVFEVGDDGDDDPQGLGRADYISFMNHHWSAGTKEVMAVKRNIVTIDANVGIKTSNPTESLYVSGNIYTTGTVRANRLDINGSNSNYQVFINGGTYISELYIGDLKFSNNWVVYEEGDELRWKSPSGKIYKMILEEVL